jgi:hypothetical protein
MFCQLAQTRVFVIGEADGQGTHGSVARN